MRIDVKASGIDFRAESDRGTKLAIKFGEGKPADDTSMNPVELLLSSLGLCVAATLQKHCMSHNLECGEITVSVEADFDPNDPVCRNIVVTASVEGEWDERRKAAFRKVAETCPVHESIVNCSSIEIRIV